MPSPAFREECGALSCRNVHSSECHYLAFIWAKSSPGGLPVSAALRRASSRLLSRSKLQGVDRVASTAGADARPRTIVRPGGPYGTQITTAVDSHRYPGYIICAPFRGLCSLHRSSDSHRARPHPGRPLQPSENQHLNYLNYLNSPPSPMSGGVGFRAPQASRRCRASGTAAFPQPGAMLAFATFRGFVR